jgi:hypothetical protein
MRLHVRSFALGLALAATCALACPGGDALAQSSRFT